MITRRRPPPSGPQQKARNLVHCPQQACASTAAAATGNNGHHKHVEHEVRLCPCPPSMPKNWCRTASNGHTQAGATPPHSLPLCHVEEHTTPGQQRPRLQGREHHLRGRNVHDVQDSALETNDTAVIVIRYHCAGSWPTPTFSNQVNLKSS